MTMQTGTRASLPPRSSYLTARFTPRRKGQNHEHAILLPPPRVLAARECNKVISAALRANALLCREGKRPRRRVFTHSRASHLQRGRGVFLARY